MKYSNPRLKAQFADWPSSGFNGRTTAQFEIETHPTKGQRAKRRTFNQKTYRWGAWKLTTFYKRARICDGDDGRTYILRDWGWSVDVLKANMQYEQEIVTSHDRPERFKELQALFDIPVPY